MLNTPLLGVLSKYGGNLGTFAGWVTALDFGNPIREHLETRSNVTVFDVSHMGRFVIRGPKSFDLLQKLVTKDLSKLGAGEMSGPALLLNEGGGIKDDVMIYKVNDETWLMVCNAVNREKDINWLMQWRERMGFTHSDVTIEDVTEKTALIAIQGPNSLKLLDSLGLKDVANLKLLNFINNISLGDVRLFLVSRSGWTGEEVRSYGFEIWADVDSGVKIYERLLREGGRPAGLIARDTLRIEMGYVLYGNDINEDINPVEARYWIALSKGKNECVGCESLWTTYKEGVSRLRVGFKLKKGVKTIPRHGYKIVVGDRVVGEVTSGAYSPTLDRCVGMGYVMTSHMYFGFNLELLVKNTRYEIKISDFPLI